MDCSIYIGTDSGNKHHSFSSFYWISMMCSPAETKKWCSTTLHQKMNGSLHSEATALSPVRLYFDELATFHEIEIRCRFKAFIDSTTAISNAVSIRDLILKRQCPNIADCMTTIKDATRVISRCVLSMLRVTKTRRPTLTSYRLQHNSI